jgi:hypothetical protein
MRIAFWITKATNTHSEYVILVAFPLQQWFRELASMLRYTTLLLLLNLAKVGAAWPARRAQFVKWVETEKFIELTNFFVKMEVFIAAGISYRLKNIRKTE